MSLEAKCPACGGDVQWKLGDSLVVICSYCRSAIARADRTLTDLGKVADLVETGSLLTLGGKGTWKGVHFTLVGHGQMAHPAGGKWDEWYASFSDGRWGWLAEAQGLFYLTFRGHTPPLPAFAAITVGGKVFDDFVAAEKGRARALGVEGELPFEWKRDAEWDYCDVSGPSGVFGTLDYSEEPALFFIGKQVTLDEIGIPPSARRVVPDATKIKALELNCPNCHGPLPLRAPDTSLRVTCPSCSGLLDVAGGKLSYLRALEKPDVEPALKLGAIGAIFGEKYTVHGYMRRGVTVDGEEYRWSEYLLHHPRNGFRWLVESKGHWSFVEPISAGELRPPGAPVQKFRNEEFKIFQRGQAKVFYVLGEFYWRVEAGETVQSVDYIAPPLMLSAEMTDDEVNWSLGTYVAPEAILEAFPGAKLPPQTGVGATQEYPNSIVIGLWGLTLIAGILVWIIVAVTHGDRTVFEHTFELDAKAATPIAGAPPEEAGEKTSTQVFFDGPVDLVGHRGIEVELHTAINNSWVAVDGDFIDETNGEVTAFGMPVEYYSGVDDGESWSEGSQSASQTLPAPREGHYTLRFEFQWEKGTTLPVTIRIRQGHELGLQFLLFFFAITFIPFFYILGMVSFESTRWEDADFSKNGIPRSFDTGGSDE